MGRSGYVIHIPREVTADPTSPTEGRSGRIEGRSRHHGLMTYCTQFLDLAIGPERKPRRARTNMQRLSRSQGPADPRIGKNVLGWRKDISDWARGVILECHIWNGKWEPQIKFVDGVKLWASVGNWKMAAVAHNEAQDDTTEAQGDGAEGINHAPASAEATSTEAPLDGTEEEPSWQHPFPILISPDRLNGDLPWGVAAPVVQAPPVCRWERCMRFRTPVPMLAEARTPKQPCDVHCANAPPAKMPRLSAGKAAAAGKAETAGNKGLTAHLSPRPPVQTPSSSRSAGGAGQSKLPSSAVAGGPSSASPHTAPGPAPGPAPCLRTPKPVRISTRAPPLACAVPHCAAAATKAHPLVTGLRVCERHERLISLVPKCCRSPCNVEPYLTGSDQVRCPVVDAGWMCHSLGCQVGLKRPCIVCGEGEGEGKSTGNEAQSGDGGRGSGGGGSGSDGGGGGGGGSSCSGGDGGGGGGGGSGGGGGGGGGSCSELCSEETREAAASGSSGSGGSGGNGKLVPCEKPGCTAVLHRDCRKLLAQRANIFWAGDNVWYRGTADFQQINEDGECKVHYDDGSENYEPLGKAAGKEDVPCEWLVARRPGQPHTSVWEHACTCSKGVVVEEGPARELEEDARHCAICCTSDSRDEPGVKNDIVSCDGCGMTVHVFCYGMNRGGTMFGRCAVRSISFLCDVCEHLGPELTLFDPGEAALTTKAKPVPTCSLCPRRGGALRKQMDGRWAHVSCVWIGSFEWQKAEGCSSPLQLCNRTSGCSVCLRNTFTIGRSRAQTDAKVKQRSWRCSARDCPNPSKVAGLVICGTGAGGTGCRRATHVSCAQRVGSGWHIECKECPGGLDGSTALQITCEACSDLFLDCTSGPTPTYRQKFPALAVSADKYVTDEEYAAANFTFMDWAHGPCFGFTRVGHRAGGLCIGACDVSGSAVQPMHVPCPHPSHHLAGR